MCKMEKYWQIIAVFLPNLHNQEVLKERVGRGQKVTSASWSIVGQVSHQSRAVVNLKGIKMPLTAFSLSFNPMNMLSGWFIWLSSHLLYVLQPTELDRTISVWYWQDGCLCPGHAQSCWTWEQVSTGEVSGTWLFWGCFVVVQCHLVKRLGFCRDLW